ncbi:transketolase [Polynucleobacter sp. TSB-Sco08W16]|uniref:transketolase n=1 Tax=Polynucleobacter sp. TSB-Sco08W16 TaxID=1758374 RepID=UPI001BFE6A46|nr:transketolase [Polynucleobacter sp. TSB-Sco08W16]QWD74555.1 transketolase [Polynucleobacter sp. TSB-Sco08W16]
MKEIQALAKVIRISSLRMVHRAKASHIGSALSISDILAVLYGRILNVDPSRADWDDRDRFILSKGHACVAVYSALAARRFFPESQLENYATDNSSMMMHISHKVIGVEFSTGSLGHGLSFGVGKALAAKKMGKKWRTFVLLSDGELGEGANWEAMMFASHHHLDNLIAVIDYNKLQSLTTVEKTLGVEPLADKIKAFGWSVQEVDGHDCVALCNAFKIESWEGGKPCLLIAHTTKGKGVSFMENRVEWHYKSPSDDQLLLAMQELENA